MTNALKTLKIFRKNALTSVHLNAVEIENINNLNSASRGLYMDQEQILFDPARNQKGKKYIYHMTSLLFNEYRHDMKIV